MKTFKEEIENSGMSFTEGGSYEAKNKEEIYLNLAKCSEEELKEVEKILKKENVFYYTNLSENRPILHYGNSMNIYGWLKGTINFLLMYNNKTEVNFQEFKEIMGVKVETSSENTQVEIFDIDFGGNCMARMEIQNGKFKFTNAMNGGGYPIAIEDIKITPTN